MTIMSNSRKFVTEGFFKIIRKIFKSDGTTQRTKRSCEEFTKPKIPSSQTDETITAENLYRRPVRQEPGKVRFGFIPEEFFPFFYNKTGVTGPYTFATTFITFLVSKELFVLEHNYYGGISCAILCYVVTKYLGPLTATALDKEIEKYESSWTEGRKAQISYLNDAIAFEHKSQVNFEGQLILVEAKRENVLLQLESAYRNRLTTVHEEVVKRLDYYVAVESVKKKIQQKNMEEWITAQVIKSQMTEKQNEIMEACLQELKTLSKEIK